jgi:hypothetical protein
MRKQHKVVLHMVMTLVTMILFAQLWLFTVALDSMESREAPLNVALTALVCSFIGCACVWLLIRFFLRTEDQAL